MSNTGIYIHIPFCNSKCAYCDFYSRVREPEIRHKYAEALINQISRTEITDKVSTVYFGGGTPSALDIEDFTGIFNVLRRFNIDENAEITLEVNPETVTDEYINGLLLLGVNRISMGVQSFCDNELRLLGRNANAEQCKNSYNVLRRCGVKNISLDLMLAIPGQTSDSLRKSLDAMLGLNPEHISAYLLKVEPDSLFGKKHIPEADEEIQKEFYLKTCEVLEDAGYEHYEISNFAKPGFRSRHNSTYWTGVPYVAFGSGASGFDGENRYVIPADIDGFIRSEGLIRPVIEETLTDTDIHNEKIMLGLRTADGISRDLLNPRQIGFIKSLIPEGLAVNTAKGFALTDRGFLVSNAVILKISDFE